MPPPRPDRSQCPQCGVARTCPRCSARGARPSGKTKVVRLRRFMPESLVGRVLASKYVVTDVIGEGGMGCVLDAHCIETGRAVAIKVLNSAAFNLVNLRRFRRECK